MKKAIDKSLLLQLRRYQQKILTSDAWNFNKFNKITMITLN